MRSNGLTAASYHPVADVDPTVADALLADLRVEGIAAYWEPVSPGTMASVERPHFVVDVRVRLYVDGAATARARQLVAESDPGLLDDSEDLAWAQIVAGFDVAAPEQPSWPVAEELPERPAEDPRVDSAEDLRLDTGSPPRTGTRPPEPEERFVPPPPPPLPRLSAPDRLAWAALVGGPVLLLAAVLFGVPLPGWVVTLGALGFIGGFVALVVRMGNGEDRLDDPDNGARV